MLTSDNNPQSGRKCQHFDSWKVNHCNLVMVCWFGSDNEVRKISVLFSLISWLLYIIYIDYFLFSFWGNRVSFQDWKCMLAGCHCNVTAMYFQDYLHLCHSTALSPYWDYTKSDGHQLADDEFLLLPLITYLLLFKNTYHILSRNLSIGWKQH